MQIRSPVTSAFHVQYPLQHRRYLGQRHQWCSRTISPPPDNSFQSSLHESGSEEYRPLPDESTPLSQTFRRGVILQRSGDRIGALAAYEEFLKAADSQGVDPALYAEVQANVGAVHAAEGRRDEARQAFSKAVERRPDLGSAWVNLALLMLADAKERSGAMSGDSSADEAALREARSCCVRALGMDNDDERSRALANKLVGDIDKMLKQIGKGG